jgi:predicted TIM-barrel fold metal-dependent hydrolase
VSPPAGVRRYRRGEAASDRAGHPAGDSGGDRAGEPVLEPDLPVCDPHHHLMDRDWIRYGCADLLEDLAAGHHVTATVYVECANSYRPDGPAHLRPVGEVEHVVAQPAPPGVMAGIVASADLALGAGVREVLDAHREAAGNRLRGIRFSTAWRAGQDNGGRKPGMLTRERVRAGLGVLGDLGLPLDCWMYPDQLDELGALAELFGAQVFVLNHLGAPLASVTTPADRPRALAAWRAAMRRLAERPNVVVKIGGLVSPLLGGPFAPGQPPVSEQIAEFWMPHVRWCIEEFGPGRCMAESNFPIDGMVADYVTVWNALKLLTAGYARSDRAAILHDTATSVYRLPAQALTR